MFHKNDYISVHRKVEQSVLHLHRIMANNLPGAALWSVVIGARELFSLPIPIFSFDTRNIHPFQNLEVCPVTMILQ